MSVQTFVEQVIKRCAHGRTRRGHHIQRGAFLLVALAAGATVVAVTAPPSISADAPPRSAKEVRGTTPYIPVQNEPPAKLIVDAPLTDMLDKGIIWIQYRTENVRILPVFGKEALDVSPRIGHLHIHVDDAPWLWADASDLNTIDIALLPPGEHKVLIELADANHQVFPGQAKTVTFTVPKTGASSH